MTNRAYRILDTAIGDTVLPTFYSTVAPVNGTSGTFAGVAPIGALLLTAEPASYQNTGTVASPTWSPYAANEGAVAITGGTINGTTVGAVTPSTGAFTSLSATGAVALSPASANVVLSPTGTGVVTINPGTAGAIDNEVIGGTTPLAGTFTTLTGTSTVSLSPASHNVTLSPTGTGQVIINPATAGTIDNEVIGGVTPLAGTFTTLTSTGQANLNGATSTAVTGKIASTTGTNLFVTDVYRCSGTNTSTGNTTLTNIVGLVGTVVIGTYRFRAVLPGVADGTGGIKFAFKLTTTVLSAMEATGLGYTASAVAVQHTTTATDQALLFDQAAAVICTIIEGTFVVSTGGTMQLQAGLHANSGSSTVLVGSSLEFCRIA